MAGFARLCPGDVFEVTIRHGPQKWKTKGRIEKTGTQRWDVPEFTFKSLVGEILVIKVSKLLHCLVLLYFLILPMIMHIKVFIGNDL